MIDPAAIKAAARAAAFTRRKAAHTGFRGAACGHLSAVLAGYRGVPLSGYLPIRTEIDPTPAMAEAAAHGLPVIAHDVGGVSEAVMEGVTGLLVPPHRPAQLAAAFKKTRLDIDNYDVLKEDEDWDDWHRTFKSMAGIDDCDEVLDHYYSPGQDEQGVFELKQKHIYAVLLKSYGRPRELS